MAVLFAIVAVAVFFWTLPVFNWLRRRIRRGR
jgi:hypothetical protein